MSFNIKPEFEELDKPLKEFDKEDFQIDNQRLLSSKSKVLPLDIFPSEIKKIINVTTSALNYPPDFLASSMLYACSVAIGNSHFIEVKRGYIQYPSLYFSLVGEPGTNKSHPVSFALKPLEDIDSDSYNNYLELTQEHENSDSRMKKPQWSQFLVSDFTPESLVEVLKHNKRGIGVYVDELASWFKNFNRYSNGSEEQFWLSAWSSKAIRVNRKTSNQAFIKNPFISVIGTIQPRVLNELSKGREGNGFTDRILFVMPENLKKTSINDNELPEAVICNWENIIKRLILFNNGESTKKMIFSPQAKELFYKWQSEMVDLSNSTHDSSLKGIYSKLEQYVLRFSLVLQLMENACESLETSIIHLKAVEGAIKLSDYFKRTALKVKGETDTSDPLNKYPSNKKNLYKKLPIEFQTKEGVELAITYGVKERAFKTFLKCKDLFEKTAHGKYQKAL